MSEHVSIRFRTLQEAIICSEAECERMAFTFVGSNRRRELTFGALSAGARDHAALLKRSGVEPGDLVIIFQPSGPEATLCFWGAILLGALPSFMPCPSAKQDPVLYWRSHGQLFRRLGKGTIVADEALIVEMGQHAGDHELRTVSYKAPEPCGAHELFPMVPSFEVAFLQHSSGTTGLKKGVALTHEAVLQQLEAYADALALRESDVIASWLPLYHDMGLITSFLLPVVARLPVVLIDPFVWVTAPQTLFDEITASGATLCWQPNFAFQHLCRTVRPSTRFNLASMRAWINCSEPCRPQAFQRFAARFAGQGVRADQLQVSYAMAETVFAVTQTRLDAPTRVLSVDANVMEGEARALTPSEGGRVTDYLSAGIPLDGLDVEVVDGDRRPVTEGYVGEIRIRGDFLFSGYFKLPEQTAAKLSEGWYYTGDLGFFDGGELFVTGRKDDLMIVHGKNFYAHELEQVLNTIEGLHPGRTVALGWFRPEVGSQEIVVVGECDVEDETEKANLSVTVKTRLLSETGVTPYDCVLVPRGWLLKTTSGKLSRSANLKKYIEVFHSESGRLVA